MFHFVLHLHDMRKATSGAVIIIETLGGRCLVHSQVAGAYGTAWYYRPSPDLSNGWWVRMRGRSEAATPEQQRVAARPWLLDGYEASPEPLALRLARQLIFIIGGGVGRLIVTGLNSFEIRGDAAHHERFTELALDRPVGQGLLTVSNHTSVIDDPSVLAAALPPRALLTPAAQKWTPCSQVRFLLRERDRLAPLIHGMRMSARMGGAMDSGAAPLIVGRRHGLSGAMDEWRHGLRCAIDEWRSSSTLP